MGIRTAGTFSSGFYEFPSILQSWKRLVPSTQIKLLESTFKNKNLGFFYFLFFREATKLILSCFSL